MDLNICLKDYSFDLPERLIAQKPSEKRDQCRLLVYDRQQKMIQHKIFSDICEEFEEGDVLVINRSKVIPCRLYFKRKSGARIEVFILKYQGCEAWALIKPSKKVKIGETLYFEGKETPFCCLLKKNEEGHGLFRFNKEVESVIQQIGQMPLPPYIKNEQDSEKLYQTVYASEAGSLAAPTAGLHFTEDLIDRLKKKGVQIAQLVLHVGLGTFSPLKEDNFSNGTLHEEIYDIPLSSIQMIQEAKRKHKKVVCVGTTSLRSLETYYQRGETQLSGTTDIFIYPPYQFKSTYQLITNFHLPQSSLFLLICSLIGLKEGLCVYQSAIDQEYHFYSYGDAMFVR